MRLVSALLGLAMLAGCMKEVQTYLPHQATDRARITRYTLIARCSEASLDKAYSNVWDLPGIKRVTLAKTEPRSLCPTVVPVTTHVVEVEHTRGSQGVECIRQAMVNAGWDAEEHFPLR